MVILQGIADKAQGQVEGLNTTLDIKAFEQRVQEIANKLGLRYIVDD